MFNVTRRVSFSVVIALLLGWGALAVMFFQSSSFLIAAETEDGYPMNIPRGVKLMLQVDKKVYRGGEAVLISLRNDSRLPIWLATSANGCPATWWSLEKLGSDEDDWQTVSRTKLGCHGTSTGFERFDKGTLRTDEWNGLLQTNAIGEVYLPAMTGTYRINVPFLAGKEAVEADWAAAAEARPSAAFTIQ